MCNLYRMTKPTAEVAHLFGAAVGEIGNAGGREVYPGYPGLVLAGGEVQAMAWGFPLALTGAKGQKLKPRPVNNAREDKLTGPFWRDSFRARRCLIPLDDWAEAEGEKGRMTRTWYSLPGDEPFAVAGIWRDTVEWGRAYSMVMVDSCPFMAEAHDRMPLILPADAWTAWQEGDAQAALALCRPWPGPLEVARTAEPWFQRPGAAGPAPRLL